MPSNIIQPPITDIIRGTLLTTQGDLIKRGAAVNERFGIGTSKQIMRVNAGVTDLEYINQGLKFSEDMHYSTGTAALSTNTGNVTTVDGMYQLPNITLGDIFIMTINVYGTFMSVDSDCQMLFYPHSGTGTWVILGGATNVGSICKSQTAGTNLRQSFCLMGRCTVTGTAFLSASCGSPTSNLTIYQNNIYIGFLPLYKQ